MLYNDNFKAIFLPVQCSQSNDFVYVLMKKYGFNIYANNNYSDPSLLTLDEVISSDEKLKEYTIFSVVDDIYSHFIWNFNAVKRIYEVDKDNYEYDISNNTHTQKFTQVIFEGVSSMANTTLESFVTNISDYSNNNILNSYFQPQSEKIFYGNDISINIIKSTEWRSQVPILLNKLDINITTSNIDELNPFLNEPVVTLVKQVQSEMDNDQLNEPTLTVDKPFYEYYDQTILDCVNAKYSVDFINFGITPLTTMEEFNNFYSST